MLRKINKIVARWNDHLAKRKTIEELHRLTDRELSDIGIARCDIHYTVYKQKRAA